MTGQRETGNRHTKKTFFSACLLTLIVAVSNTAAENLPDPTRPPATLAPLSSDAAPFQGTVLQSVMISPTRRIAIISGQRVRVGDSFGEARVVKITESEVVLRSGGELQTLKLFPDVDKRSTLKKPVSTKH